MPLQGHAVCDRCTEQLAWLCNPGVRESVPGQYARLSIVPGTSAAGAGGSHQKPGSRSPANDHVISLTDRRTNALTDSDVVNTWYLFHNAAGMLGADRDVRYAGVAVLAPYVFVRLDYVTRAPWAAEFLRGLRTAHGQLKRANGEPRPAVIGHCECGARLYNGQPITCQSCGLEYDVSEQLRALKEAE